MVLKYPVYSPVYSYPQVLSYTRDQNDFTPNPPVYPKTHLTPVFLLRFST